MIERLPLRVQSVNVAKRTQITVDDGQWVEAGELLVELGRESRTHTNIRQDRECDDAHRDGYLTVTNSHHKTPKKTGSDA